MKAMCPSGFHHNGFVEQMMYGYNCWYNKLVYIYIALLFLAPVL